MNRELLRKVVINYIHYNLKRTVGDAIKLFDENATAFYQVFDILGVDFINKVFNQITDKEIKRGRRKNS